MQADQSLCCLLILEGFFYHGMAWVGARLQIRMVVYKIATLDI